MILLHHIIIKLTIDNRFDDLIEDLQRFVALWKAPNRDYSGYSYPVPTV